MCEEMDRKQSEGEDMLVIAAPFEIYILPLHVCLQSERPNLTHKHTQHALT